MNVSPEHCVTRALCHQGRYFRAMTLDEVDQTFILAAATDATGVCEMDPC